MATGFNDRFMMFTDGLEGATKLNNNLNGEQIKGCKVSVNICRVDSVRRTRLPAIQPAFVSAVFT